MVVEGCLTVGLAVLAVGVAIQLGLGDQVGTALATTFSMPVSRRARTAAMPARMSFSPLRTTTPSRRRVAISAAPAGSAYQVTPARQIAGMLVNGLLAGIALAGDPQDAVIIEVTPDGGERVAEAEIDATHLGNCGLRIADCGLGTNASRICL